MYRMNVLDVIGNTPMLEIEGIKVKLETVNPSGSVKDRMASYILRKAIENGELKENGKILEVTSGNTGIAFAMLSAKMGYDFTAVMPESMSIERRKMMKAFGAKIILTPGEQDMSGAVAKYNEIKHSDDYFLPNQFENPNNYLGHREEFAKEILEQHYSIDAFVAGVGTGGTLIGSAMALRERHLGVKVFAVEPAESAILSSGQSGLHGIQGIGEGFIPKIVSENRDLINDVIIISTADAIAESKRIAREHGLLVGISSGANFLAAKQLKEKFENVITIFPDRGERYLDEIE